MVRREPGPPELCDFPGVISLAGAVLGFHILPAPGPRVIWGYRTSHVTFALPDSYMKCHTTHVPSFFRMVYFNLVIYLGHT